MGKTIDNLMNSGKKLFVGLSLAGLAGCAATYAKRDYDVYPAHREEIALYNMREIAEDICEYECKTVCLLPRCLRMEITPTGIAYEKESCLKSGHEFCIEESVESSFIDWDKIRKIVPGGNSVKVCSENSECMLIEKFKNSRQASDFAEAMNVYLRGR